MNRQKLSVSEAASLCGVSVRTLRYYDSIGLVRPAGVEPNGYRWYDEASLSVLQQVIFYRELEFSLKEISAMLARPDYDPSHALREHRRLLELKRSHLDALLQLVDETLEGTIMTKPKTTLADLDAAKKQYADEARARWGGTDAWAESQVKAATRTPEQELTAAQEADDIFAAFAACRGQSADSPAVQALVERWQQHITRYYYHCTPEILAGLGEMYVGDERFTKNIDRFGSGTALLMRDAIRAFCGK